MFTHRPRLVLSIAIKPAALAGFIAIYMLKVAIFIMFDVRIPGR